VSAKPFLTIFSLKVISSTDLPERKDKEKEVALGGEDYRVIHY
jgi:hypothetical protein